MKKEENGFILNNGVRIPDIGYGTWQTPDGPVATNSVKCAIRAGYRHIDGAAVYGNEKSVGLGIRESAVPRQELFVTSKLWNTERGYESTLNAFRKTLDDLGADYLDLYLIHWPASSHQFPDWEQINLDTWRAMTELYRAGKVRAIGVSNFMPHHLNALLKCDVAPMVNQIEYHPGMMQEETVSYCKANGIQAEAWSPLGTGRVLSNKTLGEIAGHYGVSVAQLCIRWCLQNEVLPLPKSTTPSRIEQNLDVRGFEISREDMERINEMEYFGGSGLHPDKVDF